MKLYRPLGFNEIGLILDTGSQRFPPRLPEQAFFYPVVNLSYAKEIAAKWNVDDKQSGYVGYVAEFNIDDEYIKEFKIQKVGSSNHKEFWIPAEKLSIFNEHIRGNIYILKAFYGKKYQGVTFINTNLMNKNYINQLKVLKKLREISLVDYICEILTQWKIVTQNYFLWLNMDFAEHGIENSTKNDLLYSIKQIMSENAKWFIKITP